jgi:predicted nucleic acid-binding protein
MEIIESLRGRKVYLDTNIFIYAVEAVVQYATAVNALFDLIEGGQIEAVTSELTLAEVLAKPFEAGRHDIAQVYETMLSPSSWLSVVPVERAILVEAARMQAVMTLRLPDAIHVATALAAGCDSLLSNDQKMKVPSDLALVRLD